MNCKGGFIKMLLGYEVKRVLRILLSIAILFNVVATYSSTSVPHRIEIVCFENINHNTVDEEEPSKYVGSIAIPKINSDLVGSGMAQELVGEISLLRKEVNAIKSSKMHRYVYEQSWSQGLQEQKKATPIYFYGGNSIDSKHEIEGVITIKPIRNLYHVKLDIIFRTHDGQEYRTTQSARIKAKDPYYFDHPKFGVLCIINPR